MENLNAHTWNLDNTPNPVGFTYVQMMRGLRAFAANEITIEDLQILLNNRRSALKIAGIAPTL